MSPVGFIEIELLSDAAFSRGEGTAGVVDIEVEHDDLGLPFLGGKTIRGLLRDSWLSMRGCFPELDEAGERVFGPEADVEERSILRIGDAVVDEETRRWIEAAEKRQNNPLTPVEVLEALTDIRRQTSEERRTGAPAETTLRSVRVVIRGLKLRAPLYWFREPTEADIRVLALAVLATRHAGLGRSRGRGHICMSLGGDIEKTRQAAKGGS
ncbi:MAG: RAMP superfamily protein [Deltaproteobacteria bacterium]|nr:RAMP superfamily protein [Deltaproteobacteria bacterium]